MDTTRRYYIYTPAAGELLRDEDGNLLLPKTHQLPDLRLNPGQKIIDWDTGEVVRDETQE